MFRRRTSRDFSEEIQSHITLEADRLRAEGWSDSAALAAARKAFGNVGTAEEIFYESTRWHCLEEWKNDLRYAVRTFLRAPGFAATAVITLALGIGANTAIFSAIDAVVFRPLPYSHPDRIVMLNGRNSGGEAYTLAPADFLDFQQQLRSFEWIAAYRQGASSVMNADRPERVEQAEVTPDFFAVFGVAAEVGRTLDRQHNPPGAAAEVVLSDGFWRRNFGGNPAIVGQSIRIDDHAWVVAGVMPPQFQYPPRTEVWTAARFAVPRHPLRPDFDQSGVRDSHYFDAIGRLKPGVDLRAARVEGSLTVRRLKQQHKDMEAEGAILTPVDEALYGDTRSPLAILLACVGLLLLIACANVAGLVLARGATRRKEFAIRAAMGAGRARLLRQFLTEALVLAAAGCVLGIALAYAAFTPVSRLLPADVTAGLTLALDARVLSFAVAISASCGILCGAFPALTLGKSTAAGLNEAARGSSAGSESNRIRSAIVIGEIALTTVLLIGAGLLIRSFSRLASEPAGFRADHVLTALLSLSQARYSNPASRARFVRNMLEVLDGTPGLSSAAVVSRLPLLPGNSTRSVDVKGRESRDSDIAPDYIAASPGYFQAIGIRLLRGRVFTDTDDAGAPPVVIINRTMARLYWPGGDPLGQSITVGVCGGKDQWCTVVGVVEDLRQHDLGESARPAVYVPYARDPWPFFAIVARTAKDPAGEASALTRAVQSVDKDEPVYGIRAMENVVTTSFAPRRLRTWFVACFAALALLLACVGIYGLVAYSVSRRTHEIGIRMALGAGRQEILTLVIGQTLRLAAVGLCIGLVLAVATTRLIGSMLYGISPTDSLSFAGSALLLAAVAAVAGSIPAWRASCMDPTRSLRSA